MFLFEILFPFLPVPLACVDPPVILKFRDPDPGIANPVEIPEEVPPKIWLVRFTFLPSLIRLNSVLVLPAVALDVRISLYSLEILLRSLPVRLFPMPLLPLVTLLDSLELISLWSLT